MCTYVRKLKQDNTVNALVFNPDEIGVFFKAPVYPTRLQNAEKNVRTEVAAALSVAVRDDWVPPS